MTHRSTAPTYQRLTVEPSCSAPDRRLAKQAKRERAQKLRKLADRAWGAPRVLESGSGVRVKTVKSTHREPTVKSGTNREIHSPLSFGRRNGPSTTTNSWCLADGPQRRSDRSDGSAGQLDPWRLDQSCKANADPPKRSMGLEYAIYIYIYNIPIPGPSESGCPGWRSSSQVTPN